MNRIRSALILLSCITILFLTSCGSPREETETQVKSVTPVTVCSIRTGTMAEYIELTATSSFQVKSIIKSPVSGYIEKCAISPGDRVSKNQLLFQLRTKEGTVLQADSLSSQMISGLIRINASINGVISTLDHPVGDFVQEGDNLCTVVLPESLVFLLDLPYEFKSYVNAGSILKLLLPDKENLDAKVRSVLPSINQTSQTQKVILQPIEKINIPEDLIAKVRIIKNIKPHAVILPKSSILTDELMKEYWVMKLMNDTLAVKLPVRTGISSTDSVEIISPVLNSSDRFLNSGNYGIGDTAVVKILH